MGRLPIPLSTGAKTAAVPWTAAGTPEMTSTSLLVGTDMFGTEVIDSTETVGVEVTT